MHCDRFRTLLEDYLEERLQGDDRDAFRAHLAVCVECRDHALAAEPSLLFAAAVQPTASAEQVDACVAGVTALIRQDRLQRNLRPSFPSWMAAAAAVVLMAGAVLLWQIAPGSTPVQPGADAGAVTAEDDSTTVPPQVDVEMGGEGVRVYQFAQEEDENTAVYFIVNSALES